MVKIEFKTSNSAFHTPSDNKDVDLIYVSHLLRDIAYRVEQGSTHGNVIDANRNVVGTYSVE